MTNRQALQIEIDDLRARLAEAEDTLEAIRTGQVDAVVVQGPEGHAVYTLTGAERVYRLLVEAMNEGALVLAPDGSIIYCNHTFAGMLSLPLEQVIGSSIYEYVAPGDLDAVRQLLEQAVWAPGRREISLNREDKTHVPAHISVGSLGVEEAAESLSAVVTDLREHKELECELEQYRRHLEELVEQRTAQLRETVGQLTVMMAARKEAEEALARSNAELAATNEELKAINEELRAEMEERERAEEALRDSEERFRALTIASSDALYRMSPDWSVMFQLHGGGFLEDTWKPNREWLQRYIHPDDQQRVLETIQAAIQAKRPFEMEHRVIRTDGSLGWTLSRAVPVLGAHGEILEWFGAASDVSGRKEIEAAKDDLLQREHRIAEALQGALIPSQVPEVIDRWSIAARYKPALKEAQVGGDFYDVFRMDDRRFGVIIGDVAGKGLAAAIRVAAIRHAIRSYAYVEPSPAEVMTLANKALNREEPDGQNVLTVVYAVVDACESRITYANAGHEPPVVRSPGGGTSDLDVTGPMLGIVPDYRYEEQQLRLQPGEEVVMFTDGITEARTGADMFQREGVIQQLKKVGEATPDEVAEALLEAATAHAAGRLLQDDVAIVILAYEGGHSG